MRTLLAAAALAIALLAAPAQGHVTTTVDPVDAPLAVGVPTEITVHFSEPCFEVLPQEAQGQDTVASGLTPDAPASIAWIGESVAFTTDMCDPTAVPFALVRATAKLLVTPSPAAPGLVNLTLPVTSYLGGGSEPGETVNLNVTVAHFALGNVTLAKGTGHANKTNATGHRHGPAGELLAIHVTYQTNADALLSVEFTSSVGTVDAIDAVRVTPPAVQNKTSGVADLEASFEPPANWTSAAIGVKAYLTPVAGGARVALGEASLTLTNDDSSAGNSTHDDHVHSDEEDTPAPAFAAVAIALLAVAVLRRRSA